MQHPILLDVIFHKFVKQYNFVDLIVSLTVLQPFLSCHAMLLPNKQAAHIPFPI